MGGFHGVPIACPESFSGLAALGQAPELAGIIHILCVFRRSSTFCGVSLRSGAASNVLAGCFHCQSWEAYITNKFGSEFPTRTGLHKRYLAGYPVVLLC